jgi:hypothetical protein
MHHCGPARALFGKPLSESPSSQQFHYQLFWDTQFGLLRLASEANPTTILPTLDQAARIACNLCSMRRAVALPCCFCRRLSYVRKWTDHQTSFVYQFYSLIIRRSVDFLSRRDNVTESSPNFTPRLTLSIEYVGEKRNWEKLRQLSGSRTLVRAIL